MGALERGRKRQGEVEGLFREIRRRATRMADFQKRRGPVRVMLPYTEAASDFLQVGGQAYLFLFLCPILFSFCLVLFSSFAYISSSIFLSPSGAHHQGSLNGQLDRAVMSLDLAHSTTNYHKPIFHGSSRHPPSEDTSRRGGEGGGGRGGVQEAEEKLPATNAA